LFFPVCVSAFLAYFYLINNGYTDNLNCSPNIIGVIKSRKKKGCSGNVERIGEVRNVCRRLVGKPEGKRLLVIPRHVCMGDDKMALEQVGYESMKWIHLA
jgi:hypothetical protein